MGAEVIGQPKEPEQPLPGVYHRGDPWPRYVACECGKLFWRPSANYQHGCERCKRIFTRISTRQERYLVCGICEDMFNMSKFSKADIRARSESGYYICGYCNDELNRAKQDIDRYYKWKFGRKKSGKKRQ